MLIIKLGSYLVDPYVADNLMLSTTYVLFNCLPLLLSGHSLLACLLAGPSKVFEVWVYSLENRRLPKGVVASRLCRDEGKMGVNCL